jgi:Na+-transporting methylmalonyl-CoA/oxaloacetate decarboxylase gamma subunit
VSTATPTTASNGGDSQWATRLHYWKIWAELNWLPLLIGGLVFLALLILLFALRGVRRNRVRSEPGAESAKKEAPSVTVATRDNAPASPANPSGYTEAVVAPKSSQPSPAEQYEHGGEDQEREVFEL